jgi:hypothetical protein
MVFIVSEFSLIKIINITCRRIAEQRWEEALGGVAAADQAATAMLGNDANLGAKALNTLIPPLLALVSFCIVSLYPSLVLTS